MLEIAVGSGLYCSPTCDDASGFDAVATAPEERPHRQSRSGCACRIPMDPAMRFCRT